MFRRCVSAILTLIMDIFEPVVRALACVPDFVPFLIYPAVLAVVAVLMLTLGGRKAYPYAASALGAAAFSILAAKDVASAFVFAGFYAALAAALRLLFFLPVRGRKKGKRSKDERMYEKFRADLAEGGEGALPPKVEKFDAEPVTAEESGLSLCHAEQLLSRLFKLPLSATDRLEAEVISRSLDAYREKPLSEEELRTLNDCLSAVLKLTAKYKL